MGAWPHMTRNRLILRVVLYAAFYAALAALLPWFVFVPLAALVVVADLTWETRRLARRYQRVLDDLHRSHGPAIRRFSGIRPGEVDATLYGAFKELANEIERQNAELVQRNVQLLSVREIGLSLLASLDEAKIVDAVINFLSNGLGYRELFIGIFRPEREVLELTIFRDTPRGHSYESATVPLETLDGAFRSALLAHRSERISDTAQDPLDASFDPPRFAESTMSSYAVVPMVKSGATHGCAERVQCIVHRRRRREGPSPADTTHRCAACGRFPVLGVLGVTDGFRAAPLGEEDVVAVETLGVQVSTILENNRLFAELRQEESFRNNVINSMMTGLITADPSGRILFANERAAEMTGLTIDQLLGRDVSEILVDGRDEEGTPVMRTLRKGRKAFEQEAWVVQKDGGREPIVLNTSFLVDENRAVQGVLAVFRDVARLKGMEEQIAHLDKLAALGRLSSSIAHEIRNPLAGIAAGIQYFQRAGHAPESQKENIDFILEEVNRIDRLIGDLMNVVRVSDLIYETVEIESVIQDSVKGVVDLARQKDVDISIRVPPSAPRITVDTDRIKQVMINLIKNAIEASPQGSDVTISVSLPQPSDVVFDASQDFAIIAVRDEGLGLAEEDRNRVFEPFFSKKSTGTGLGLYVAHSIIERHGGYIYVDSEYGVGTTFSVYLPVEQVHHGNPGNPDKVSHPAGR